jgi:hypothetical protein
MSGDSFDFSALETAITLESADVNPLDLHLQVEQDIEDQCESYDEMKLEESVRNMSKGITEDTDRAYGR